MQFQIIDIGQKHKLIVYWQTIYSNICASADISILKFDAYAK